MIATSAIVLVAFWLLSCISFFVWAQTSTRRKSIEWCNCGRVNLKERDYRRTKNQIVHRRHLCCPSRETIW